MQLPFFTQQHLRNCSTSVYTRAALLLIATEGFVVWVYHEGLTSFFTNGNFSFQFFLLFISYVIKYSHKCPWMFWAHTGVYL